MAAEQPQLAEVASRAFGWSFLNTAVSRLGTLAIGIVLARVLGPVEFGTFAVATVALLAMLSFNDLGVSLAIVRWKDDPRAITGTVTSISVVTSAVLVVAVWFTAPAFCAAMGDPAATGVVRLMALSILINGFVATPAALMQRAFQQRRRMAIDQVNTWLGAAVSLILALSGLGAISLAIGRITGGVVSGVMFVAWSPQRYRFGFDLVLARSLLRFGLPLAGASVVVFAVGYADQLVTGILLGSTALGFYVLAFNLASWPVSIFSQPLRSVAPAAFARLQHDPTQMNLAFHRTLRLLVAIAMPACLLLAGVADPLVTVVYGKAWEPAAPVLMLLGVVAAMRIIFELSYDFLVVRGRSRGILIVQLVWLVVGIPALIIGARLDGLRGIALAQLVVVVAVVFPAYLVVLRGAGLKTGVVLAQLWPATLLGLAVLFAARGIASAVDQPLLACLLAGFVALGAVSLGLARQRPELLALRTQWREGSRRR